MTIPTKQSLLTFLRHNELIVTFNKINGDERVMNCTLDKTRLPEDVVEKLTEEREGDTLVVWDTNQSAWRSFRYANVTKVTTVGGENKPVT
jgi:hypothetical protein